MATRVEAIPSLEAASIARSYERRLPGDLHCSRLDRTECGWGLNGRTCASAAPARRQLGPRAAPARFLRRQPGWQAEEVQMTRKKNWSSALGPEFVEGSNK